MVMTGRREQWQQVAQARLAAGQLCQLLLEQLGFGIEVAALGPRRDRPGRPLGSYPAPTVEQGLALGQPLAGRRRRLRERAPGEGPAGTPPGA